MAWRFGKILNRKRIIVALVMAILFWLSASGVMAWKLTHRRKPPFPEHLPQVDWAEFEQHRLRTVDGESVGAWLVRTQAGKGTVLVLHGNGGSRSSSLETMKLLAENEFSVMAISLRCHGDSSGDLNDFGWSARHDVVASVEFLRREFPGQPIYVVGRSLGAAAAIFAASELKNDVAGYFLEQPYKDLPSATWYRIERRLPMGLDAIAYAGLRLWSLVLIPENARIVSPHDAATRMPKDVPIVFLGGSADQLAPLRDVTAVYRQVESHAKLVVFDGATHEHLNRYDPSRYATTLLAFINQAPLIPTPNAAN